MNRISRNTGTKKLSLNPKEARTMESVLADPLDSRFRGNDDLKGPGTYRDSYREGYFHSASVGQTLVLPKVAP